jgi:hypothetical protein
MRSIVILILICLNIFDDNRWEFFLNVSENFLRNIKFYLMNDLFRRFCITIFHNDIDCSRCHWSHILLRSDRLLLSRMTTILSVLWKNRLRLFVTEKYEMCRVFSLTATNLIDTHLSRSSWFYMIQFIYDSTFETIFLFLCFWCIIISRLRSRIQMRVLLFDQRIFFEYLEYVLISS